MWLHMSGLLCSFERHESLVRKHGRSAYSKLWKVPLTSQDVCEVVALKMAHQSDLSKCRISEQQGAYHIQAHPGLNDREPSARQDGGCTQARPHSATVWGASVWKGKDCPQNLPPSSRCRAFVQKGKSCLQYFLPLNEPGASAQKGKDCLQYPLLSRCRASAQKGKSHFQYPPLSSRSGASAWKGLQYPPLSSGRKVLV